MVVGSYSGQLGLPCCCPYFGYCCPLFWLLAMAEEGGGDRVVGGTHNRDDTSNVARCYQQLLAVVTHGREEEKDQEGGLILKCQMFIIVFDLCSHIVKEFLLFFTKSKSHPY